VNILHISAADRGGGSARSAYRLHAELRRQGHLSRMLVGVRRTADEDVRTLKRSPVWRAADRACGAVMDGVGLQYVLYPSSFAVAADPWFQAAEVVQLSNLHGSYFSLSALPLLGRRRPLVWRLSDMWPLTGHVAYSFECERWRLGCGSCPRLRDYPGLPHDTSALLWRWKRAVYGRTRLTVVAPSRWLEGIARSSPLLGRFDVHRIPNGVDLELFRPVDKPAARLELGLRPDGPTVLFSAPDLDDPRKGGAVLREALALLGDVEHELVVTGGNPRHLPAGARHLGDLDGARLALSYAAADVFCLPSLADNLPNAVLESLACGTPCVSFAVGGIPDAVRHLETGWLAAPGDPAALAAGVRALLGDAELCARLGARGRELAESEFSAELEARRFVELYATLAP
jgi:glycosyltransferase involved in cell wall biosynthesis